MALADTFRLENLITNPELRRSDRLLADGFCVLEVRFSSPLMYVDLATTNDLEVAARNLVTNCVEGRSIGGLVKGIGKTIPSEWYHRLCVKCKS